MILVSMRLNDSPAALRRRFAALRPGLCDVEGCLRTATPDLPFPIHSRRPSHAGRGPRRLGLARRCFGRFPTGGRGRSQASECASTTPCVQRSKHRTAHSKAKRRTCSAAHNAGLKMRRHIKSIRRCRAKDKPSGFHTPHRAGRSGNAAPAAALLCGSAALPTDVKRRVKILQHPSRARQPAEEAIFFAAKQTENAAAIRLCMKPHTQGAG